MYIQNVELDSCLYLYKGAGDGSTPQLVQQGFTHGDIRNTGNPVRDYNDTFDRKTSKKNQSFFFFVKNWQLYIHRYTIVTEITVMWYKTIH